MDGGEMSREMARFNSVDGMREYTSEKFNPKALFEDSNCKVILAFFKEGQFIPVHSPSVDLFLYIIEGEGEVMAGNEVRQVRTGDIVVVPRKEKRGVRASSDMTALHVVTPAPTEEDHREVKEGLLRGSWI
jgi:quercetin dioxygenase-like cupin family protein